jgi:hypothetical protein
MAMTREEILARYRRLRAISRRHHEEALRFLSRHALLDHARALGLAFGKTIVADNEGDLTLVFDLMVHAPKGTRSRAIDRYRKATPLAPDSDEARVLEAMCRARFSLWQVERRHETAGLVVLDLLRQTEVWLVDEGLEQSAREGMSMASRLYMPEDFAMTAGVIVPIDRDIVEEALDISLIRTPKDPDALASDPRFAMALYRAALDHDAMESVQLS